MLKKYDIKRINNNNVLYLYVNGDVCGELSSYVKNIIADNDISFDGDKAIIIVNDNSAYSVCAK